MQLPALLRRAAPYRAALLAISGLTLLASLGTLAVPWLGSRLLAGAVADTSAQNDAQGGFQSGTLAALLVIALVGTTLLGIAAAMLSARTAGRALADLRQETHTHIQSLPLAFHDESAHGDLLALMTYEVTSLSQFLTSTLASVPAMLVTAGGAAVLLLLLDPLAGLIVPLLLPVGVIALKLVGRRQRALAAEARAAEAELVIRAEQDLAMLPAIKAFAAEPRQTAAFRDAAQAAFALGFRQARIAAVLGPLMALGAGLAVIALLLASGGGQGSLGQGSWGQGSGSGGRAGSQSAADLFAVLLYAALLVRPVGALADLYGRLQWARGTLARLERVLALPGEAQSGAALAPSTAPAGIAFEQVDFAFPGRPPLLRNLSLVIHPGEIVALTGSNGAGKSTLIHLLLRFYAPGAGRILLDGQDIAGLRLADLRRQFGLVPQRPLLMGGTLRENITFGAPGADDAAISAALRLAQAEGFVASLPQGLETRIGDDGVQLSGGQRQRVGLARALLADPRILIFDEATAMYDLASEAAFVAACRTALAGRTVIIVTHRPASLALAHRVIAINGGAAHPVAPAQAPGDGRS